MPVMVMVQKCLGSLSEIYSPASEAKSEKNKIEGMSIH